jgi:hypothetical protein
MAVETLTSFAKPDIPTRWSDFHAFRARTLRYLSFLYGEDGSVVRRFNDHLANAAIPPFANASDVVCKNLELPGQTGALMDLIGTDDFEYAKQLLFQAQDKVRKDMQGRNRQASGSDNLSGVVGKDRSGPDFESLLELADSRFFQWKQEALRPEWDRRMREIDRSDMGSSGRAVSRIAAYRELLEREVRERIKIYRDVAGEYGASDMLSTPRLEALRERIMTDVEASVSTLKQQIVSGARAAGDVLESALPHGSEYTGLTSAILTVVNVELSVLESEGKMAGRSESPDLTSMKLGYDGDLTSGDPLSIGTQAETYQDTNTRSRLSGSTYSPMAAKRVESYIKTKGISVKNFAELAGTTDRTLRSFRKTGRIRTTSLPGIASAMGTTVEKLLEPE